MQSKAELRTAKLHTELQDLDRRRERRQVEIDADHCRRLDILDELHRLRCGDLLNVPNGVKLRSHQSAGSRFAFLNDAAGTLTKIRRNWGEVNFGPLGTWRVELNNLRPTSGEVTP